MELLFVYYLFDLDTVAELQGRKSHSTRRSARFGGPKSLSNLVIQAPAGFCIKKIYLMQLIN